MPDRPPVKDCYIHPALYVSESRVGKGLFTRSLLKKGDVITNWAPLWEQRMCRKDAFKHSRAGNHYIMQADDNSYFVSLQPDQADYINHSCEPNIGLNGLTEFVAMRDIEPGEEITFDYAISESDPWWTMRCECGRPSCRKLIRGTDWKDPVLQKKYSGYFSEHIKKKIRWRPARRWIDDGLVFFRRKLHNLLWRVRHEH